MSSTPNEKSICSSTTEKDGVSGEGDEEEKKQFRPVSIKKHKKSFVNDEYEEEPNYDYYFCEDAPISGTSIDDTGRRMGEENNDNNNVHYYILGTLQVRLIAARGNFLEVVRRQQQEQNQGLLSSFPLMIGGGTATAANAAATNTCYYGELSFLSQTQVTSQVYNTSNATNITWPRSEEYYLDVTIPIPAQLLPTTTYSSTKGNNTNTCQFKEEEQDEDDKEQLFVHYYTDDEDEEPLHNKHSYYSMPIQNPILSLCIFQSDKLDTTTARTSSKGKKAYEQQKQEKEDVFVGFTSINLLPLLTGQISCLDQWITLHTTTTCTDSLDYSSTEGEVRISCEYVPSDPPPKPGDYVRLTTYCFDTLFSKSLFPISSEDPTRLFLVDDVRGHKVHLSYYTPQENWLCKFQVHTYMILCAKRQRQNVSFYELQESIRDVAQKLAYSPMVTALQSTLTETIPNDGLLNVGAQTVSSGISLLARWLGGGLDTVVNDVVYATNFDGNHTPMTTATRGIDRSTVETAEEEEEEEDDFIQPSKGTKDDIEGPEYQREAIPGMPSCPITGQPMRDPGKKLLRFYLLLETKKSLNFIIRCNSQCRELCVVTSHYIFFFTFFLYFVLVVAGDG